MNLTLDMSLAEKYKSNSQIARVVTESWIYNNMFCPHCGMEHINSFEKNRPVADFYCSNCNNQYELKSKNGTFGKKVNDGAYSEMIKRITSNNNPDFLLMSYSKSEFQVRNIIFISKHFFTPDIIEQRLPLAETSKRAGWMGCNILLYKIPVQGRIPIITKGQPEDRNDVLRKVQMAETLKIADISARGWLMDILNCINKIKSNEFSLTQMYGFEYELQQKHPNNNNVQPKIRQQLQLLRDRGIIDFLGNGHYKKQQI